MSTEKFEDPNLLVAGTKYELPGPRMRETVVVRCKSLLQALWLYVKADVAYVVFTIVVTVAIRSVGLSFKNDILNLQSYRSFDLNDTSISYEHQSSKVSGNANIFITSLYALILSLLGNYLIPPGCKRMNCKRSCCNDRTAAECARSSAFSEVVIKRESKLHQTVGVSVSDVDRLRMYRLFWGVIFLLLALAETNMLTNFTKTMMGVLKPHFLVECDPDISALPRGETWVNETLTRTICRNSDTDYRRSFPSGHASQAAVCIMYALLEVHRIPNAIAARVIQLFGLTYMLLICCFRISGNHHNWFDVFAGAVLGVILATTCYFMKEMQIRRQFKTENQKIYEKIGPAGTPPAPGSEIIPMKESVPQEKAI